MFADRVQRLVGVRAIAQIQRLVESKYREAVVMRAAGRARPGVCGPASRVLRLFCLRWSGVLVKGRRRRWQAVQDPVGEGASRSIWIVDDDCHLAGVVRNA
jgi:hypothetical protein